MYQYSSVLVTGVVLVDQILTMGNVKVSKPHVNHEEEAVLDVVPFLG
jgi:hypothetical protein